MAILFDLDGTLIDTADDLINTTNNLCAELNKPTVDPKLLKDNLSFGLEKMLQIALNINITEINAEYLEELKNRFRVLYRQSKFIDSKLFPGIELLIANLKEHGFKIGVVTNKTLEFASLTLDRVNLLTVIDCLVASDMVSKPKPHPEPVLLAMDKLQVKPHECIFIGDAEQDIISGNAAGVRTVAALFGYVGNKTVAKTWPAKYFVTTPTDLWPLVQSLFASNFK